jgi:flagellar assembly protein FliH
MAGVPAWDGDTGGPGSAVPLTVDVPRSDDADLGREIASAREDGRRAGFAQGHAEGLARAREEVAAIAAVHTRLAELAESLEQRLAGEVLALTLDLVRQMVRQAIRVHPELVLAVIREAVRSFPDLGPGPKLMLHPEDAAVVRAIAQDGDEDLAAWVIVEDERLERGGCRIQTASSEIDATLDNRWRRVVASLGRDDAWLDTRS